jgi:hypothetical protein
MLSMDDLSRQSATSAVEDPNNGGPFPLPCRLKHGPRPADKSIELSQDVEELRVVRRFGDVVHVDVADDALLVDDHDGALADAFVVFPDAVLPRHFALGMEIGEQWIPLDAADGFCECYVEGTESTEMPTTWASYRSKSAISASYDGI